MFLFVFFMFFLILLIFLGLVLFKVLGVFLMVFFDCILIFRFLEGGRVLNIYRFDVILGFFGISIFILVFVFCLMFVVVFFVVVFYIFFFKSWVWFDEDGGVVFVWRVVLILMFLLMKGLREVIVIFFFIIFVFYGDKVIWLGFCLVFLLMWISILCFGILVGFIVLFFLN